MRALLRLGWLEVKLLLREPLTLVFSLALPLIVLLVLGGVFGDTPSTDPSGKVYYRGVGPMSFYVPAYLALVVTSVAVISLPTHLAGYRERGVLKRYRAASVGALTIAGSQLIVTLALSAASAVVLLVGAAVAYDFQGPGAVLPVIGTFVVVVVGFTAFGFLLGALLPTARAAQALGLMLWFVMMMLGGAGPPQEVLGDTMRFISDASPLLYAIQLLHQAWFGLYPGAAWWVFLGFAAISAALALRFFRW